MSDLLIRGWSTHYDVTVEWFALDGPLINGNFESEWSK